MAVDRTRIEQLFDKIRKGQEQTAWAVLWQWIKSDTINLATFREFLHQYNGYKARQIDDDDWG